MGLLKAGIGAVGGVLADQWKEYFYCEAMDRDILVMKGRKRTGKRSSNKKGDDNIISNGSVIAVADGQCMLIVDQGKVVEVCAQPGEFVYDTSTEPSIFSGDLGESLNNTFNKIGQRFAFGGDTGKDQRVYYFNTKEIMDNRFGTPSPIPFRVVDRNIGLDIDVSVRCNGVYSYRITDPILFYTNVCGNVSEEYTREELDSQLKAEFLTALQPGFARISEMGIRPNAIPGHLMELTDAMDKILSEKWQGLRGLKIVSIGMNQVTLPEEDAEMIKQAQRMAILQNPSMAAATLAGAQAEAMKMAASNQNGAMMGFAGHEYGICTRRYEYAGALPDGSTAEYGRDAAGNAWGTAIYGRDAAGNAWSAAEHGRDAAGDAWCTADCARKLAVPVRHDCNREILSGMRFSKTGCTGSVDLLLWHSK